MKKLVMIAALVIAGSAQAQDAPAGDVRNGAAHFVSDGCWQCHNYGGIGAALTGPRLARTALPFEAFLHQLRQPASEMAPYEAAVLSDQTAADIYAWLKSQPEPPKLENLPLLQTMGVK